MEVLNTIFILNLNGPSLGLIETNLEVKEQENSEVKTRTLHASQ